MIFRADVRIFPRKESGERTTNFQTSVIQITTLEDVSVCKSHWDASVLQPLHSSYNASYSQTEEFHLHILTSLNPIFRYVAISCALARCSSSSFREGQVSQLGVSSSITRNALPLHHGRGGPQDPEIQPQRAIIQELPLSSLFVSVELSSTDTLELQKPTFLCVLMQNHDELSSAFWLCAELSRVPIGRLILFIIW